MEINVGIQMACKNDIYDKLLLLQCAGVLRRKDLFSGQENDILADEMLII